MSLRSLGGTVGLAIYQALLSDELGKLPVNVAGAAAAAGLPEMSIEAFVGAILGNNQTALMAVSGVTSDIIVAGTNAKLDTYVLGFRYISGSPPLPLCFWLPSSLSSSATSSPSSTCT